MKYEVTQTRIYTPSRSFMQGEVVTEKDFKDAGSEDWQVLVDNGAVAPLKGTEDEGDTAEIPSAPLAQGSDPVPHGTTPRNYERIQEAAAEADQQSSEPPSSQKPSGGQGQGEDDSKKAAKK